LSEFVKIGDLNPSSRGVNLIAKVVSKTEPRVVGSQYDNAEHKLSTALIADERASDVELEEVNTENNLSEKVVSSPGYSGSRPRERFQRRRTFGRRSGF
jgi:replication factor A1